MSGVFYCSPPYSFESLTELRLHWFRQTGCQQTSRICSIYRYITRTQWGSVKAPVHTYVCHRATHTHNLPEESKEMTFTLVKRIRTDSIKLGHEDAKDSGDRVNKGGNGQQVFLEVGLYVTVRKSRSKDKWDWTERYRGTQTKELYKDLSGGLGSHKYRPPNRLCTKQTVH